MMVEKVVLMKKIFKRLLNLITIYGVVVFLDWLFDLITGSYSGNYGLYISAGILVFELALRYVFFGEITLWSKVEKE